MLDYYNSWRDCASMALELQEYACSVPSLSNTIAYPVLRESFLMRSRSLAIILCSVCDDRLRKREVGRFALRRTDQNFLPTNTNHHDHDSSPFSFIFCTFQYAYVVDVPVDCEDPFRDAQECCISTGKCPNLLINDSEKLCAIVQDGSSCLSAISVDGWRDGSSDICGQDYEWVSKKVTDECKEDMHEICANERQPARKFPSLHKIHCQFAHLSVVCASCAGTRS